MVKIAILAGEASGDIIGSHLMSYLNSKIKNIEFIGVGGPEMSKNGLISYFDYREISVHGYFDALKKNFPIIILKKQGGGLPPERKTRYIYWYRCSRF